MRVALALLICGCATTAQTIDTYLDCRAICGRYATCFDSSYDVNKCELSCRAKARHDKAFRHKADECDACISKRSCAGASFSCAIECVSVVP